MSSRIELLEAVMRHAGARSASLFPATAGLLGLEPSTVVGAQSLGAFFAHAMPVPGRSGGELAHRIVSLFGARRRGVTRRLVLRVTLPGAGGAVLLLERGEEAGPAAGLALALDALAAALRPAPLGAELLEAAAFIALDDRLLVLTDRTGRPQVVSPLLRQVLAQDRSGRPFLLTPEGSSFFRQLEQLVVSGQWQGAEAQGLERPGSIHLSPLLEGAFVLAEIRGEVANAASLRSLADADLTPRELTCGLHLAEGKSYRGIADELGVSPDTVKLHLRALYQKVAVDGRDGLVARMAGLAPPPPVTRGIARR